MKLKVTQRRSVIDRPRDQKDTVRRLANHLPQHGKLLIVLLAEDREIGRDLIE